jgi:hypothetical protein
MMPSVSSGNALAVLLLFGLGFFLLTSGQRALRTKRMRLRTFEVTGREAQISGLLQLLVGSVLILIAVIALVAFVFV